MFKKAVCVSLWVVLLAMTAAGAEGGGDDTIVAEGDGFILTQNQINAYRSAIVPDNTPSDRKGLLSAIFRFELLSREYFKQQQAMGVQLPPEETRTIEMKVHAAKKYMQDVLNDYALPEEVIETYYRSYPEKFRAGNTTGASGAVMPLDDALKTEIRFIIVEKKKNAIIEDAVRNLVAQSNIKIINEYH